MTVNGVLKQGRHTKMSSVIRNGSIFKDCEGSGQAVRSEAGPRAASAMASLTLFTNVASNFWSYLRKRQHRHVRAPAAMQSCQRSRG